MNQLKEAGEGTVLSGREEGYKGTAETVRSGTGDRPKEIIRIKVLWEGKGGE